MDAKELMIGDIVGVPIIRKIDSVLENQVQFTNDVRYVEVFTIYFDSVEVRYKIRNDDVIFYYETVPSQKLVPIPLTKEMLMSNGFNKHDNRFAYREYKLEICIEKYADDCIMLSIGHTHHGRYDNIHVRIHHVHELQHALRLFGLGDIANNFKIEAK